MVLVDLAGKGNNGFDIWICFHVLVLRFLQQSLHESLSEAMRGSQNPGY